MNIGRSITESLTENNISRREVYESIRDYLQTKDRDYVTYERFCTKLNENKLTAEELFMLSYFIKDNLRALENYFIKDMSNTLRGKPLFRDTFQTKLIADGNGDCVAVKNTERAKKFLFLPSLMRVIEEQTVESYMVGSTLYGPGYNESDLRGLRINQLLFIRYNMEKQWLIYEKITETAIENGAKQLRAGWHHEIVADIRHLGMFLRIHHETPKKFKEMEVAERFHFIDKYAKKFYELESHGKEHNYFYPGDTYRALMMEEPDRDADDYVSMLHLRRTVR